MRIDAKTRLAPLLATVIGLAAPGLAAPGLARAQVPPRQLPAVRVTVSATTFGWMQSRPGTLALRSSNPLMPVVYRPTMPMAAATSEAAPARPAVSTPPPPTPPPPPFISRPFAALDRHDNFGDMNMSCVPYARAVSGINVRGNAADWWDNAAGAYGRGHAPEPGSVLSFQSIGRMPLGHVAVVSRIVSKTMIMIDHANWDEAGTIMRGIPVVDVSPNNDWTQVRVDTGGGTFGAIYPTDGFIYRHHEDGVMSAESGASPTYRLASAAASTPAFPRPSLPSGGMALPVVHNGPSGGDAFYLAGNGLGASSPLKTAIPGVWSFAPTRPRLIIASNRLGR